MIFDTRHPRTSVFRDERFMWAHASDPVNMRVEKTDYEADAEQFCLEFAFPYLAKHGYLDYMESFLHLWFSWYHGEEKDDVNVNSDDPRDSWIIEPVTDIVSAVFDLKLRNTEHALKLMYDWRNHVNSVGPEMPPQILQLDVSKFSP